MLKRKQNRTAAFSLIEVVVGIAVLGLVTAPVCASLVLSVRLNAHAQALMDARLQASGVVETLLAEGIDEETDDGELELEGLPEGVTVTVEASEDGPYYDVTVTSSVGVEGKEETVVLATSVRAVEPPDSAPESEGDA